MTLLDETKSNKTNADILLSTVNILQQQHKLKLKINQSQVWLPSTISSLEMHQTYSKSPRPAWGQLWQENKKYLTNYLHCNRLTPTIHCFLYALL